MFHGKIHYKWWFSIANCWHNQRPTLYTLTQVPVFPPCQAAVRQPQAIVVLICHGGNRGASSTFLCPAAITWPRAPVTRSKFYILFRRWFKSPVPNHIIVMSLFPFFPEIHHECFFASQISGSTSLCTIWKSSQVVTSCHKSSQAVTSCHKLSQVVTSSKFAYIFWKKY